MLAQPGDHTPNRGLLVVGGNYRHCPAAQRRPHVGQSPFETRKLRQVSDRIVTAVNATAPRLSVLVVTWNERELVKRSLPPLLEQLRDGDELIVADNDPSDGTAAPVERLAPAATVIRM